MWYVFRNAFVRKLAYIVCGLLFAFFAHRSHAQCPKIYTGTDSSGDTCSSTSASGCISQLASEYTAHGGGNTYSGYVKSDDGTSTWSGGFNVTFGGGFCPGMYCGTTSDSGQTVTGQIATASTGCSNPCASVPSQDLAATNWVPTQSSGLCYAGCLFQINPAVTTVEFQQIILMPSASPNGSQCVPATSTPLATSGTNCITKAGQTLCVSDLQNYAVINGNTVTPANAPAANNCVGYSDGSVTCGGTPWTTGQPIGNQSTATPPGPDNGTPGVPATPTATVIGNGTLQNYYSPATCAASTVGCGSKGTGSGNTGTNPTQTAAAGIPGDCNQSASDAAGCHGVLPSVVRYDSIASNTASMIAALQTTPLISAMVAAGTFTLPVGTCPTATFTIFGGHTYDLFASACTLFNMQLNNLIAISEAVWGTLAVFIVFSA